MPTEAEKRLHRCCFSGQRPEKLGAPEVVVKNWLSSQIDAAISAGCRTFLCGMGMGVDIWAGQIVAERRKVNQALRLVCAVPWPGFSNKWGVEWQEQYSALLREADLVVPVSHQYRDDVFEKRNKWLVDHSSRVIACYNGEPGGTMDLVGYALSQKVPVFTNVSVFPDLGGRPREVVNEVKWDPVDRKALGPTAVYTAVKQPYPGNLLTAIGPERIFGKNAVQELNPDQLRGLEHVLNSLGEKERGILLLRYREGKSLPECGKQYNVSKQRVSQIEQKLLRKLRHPFCVMYIRDGFEKTELALKIACAEEMKRCLEEQKKRYPLMNEEDVVKFVFQGMLGVGHLIYSEGDALKYLEHETAGLEPDAEEPLTEEISPDWFRLNLRAAKAKGISVQEISGRLFRSAEERTGFTRQDVYRFCTELDGSERMKAAAQEVSL